MTLNKVECDNEEELVEELRNRIKGEISEILFENKNMFIRFLRARNHNLNAAEAMLKRHIKWRQIYQIETILKDYTPNQVFEQFCGVSRIGFDKEGWPIMYLDVGNIDTRGVLKCVKGNDVIKYFAYTFELNTLLYKQQSEKHGKVIDQMTFIVNFDNFSLLTATHKETIEIFITLILQYEANFPERLKAAIAINTSFYFSIMWAVLKPFVTARSYEKIRIYGKTGWENELLKTIDADTLPAFLGGNRTDPDGNPQCYKTVPRAERIPETYFINRNQNLLLKLPDAKRLIIARKSKATIKQEILQPKSRIEWEFIVKNNKDIGFALLYQRYGNENCPVKEISPNRKVETSLHAESGLFLCDTPGIYTLEFDNSYSWIHHKEIYYTVSIVKPSASENN